MSILEVKGVKKVYTTRFGNNKVEALKNVNFQVEKGEYVAIMGESGSGKSTFLRCLNLLEEPSGGEIFLDGENITGYDIDGKMVEIANKNAEEAGLAGIINFKQQAVKDFKTEQKNGVMIGHPPYGQRLSDQKAAREIYRQLGTVTKPLVTWSKYFITSDLDFEKYYGQSATKKRKLYNGALRTDYFQFWGKRER